VKQRVRARGHDDPDAAPCRKTARADKLNDAAEQLKHLYRAMENGTADLDRLRIEIAGLIDLLNGSARASRTTGIRRRPAPICVSADIFSRDPV